MVLQERTAGWLHLTAVREAEAEAVVSSSSSREASPITAWPHPQRRVLQVRTSKATEETAERVLQVAYGFTHLLTEPQSSLNSFPFRFMIFCPIEGKVRITQRFGLNPEIYKQFGLAGHNGIDFTGEMAGVLVPVYSPFEGKIVEVGDEGNKGYGKFVRIRTDQLDGKNRRKEVVLAHLSEFGSGVEKGAFIYQYDKVGTMGNTGFSSGPHLHCGLRFLSAQGGVLDHKNGYKGYVDFLPYLRGVMDQGMFAMFFKFPYG